MVKKSLLGKIAKAIVIASIPLITMFPKLNAQEFSINPFAQPNDTTLAYYGSGDSDGNNILNQDDLDLMSVKSGQVDQADVDGNGISFETSDYTFLFEHINNGIYLPQNNWANSNLTPEQRKDWVKKMLIIDKTDTLHYVSGEFECGNFSTQTIINFYGFSELKDSTIASKFLKYNLNNNGKFNLPVYDVAIRAPPEWSWAAHAINACLIGDDPLNFDDWYFFEPQNDQEVTPGYWSMPENSKVTINYTVRFKDTGGISQLTLIRFQLNESTPLLEYSSDRLILQSPNVKIASNLESLADSFNLAQNYPNPANPNTTIKYSIPFEENVNLQVYDLKGNLVETLVNKKQRAGEYQVDLNASNLSSGIYLYRIETSAGIKTKKMSVLK